MWTGENDTKTRSVDANFFENGAKQLRFRLKRISVHVALIAVPCFPEAALVVESAASELSSAI